MVCVHKYWVLSIYFDLIAGIEIWLLFVFVFGGAGWEFSLSSVAFECS